VWPSLIQRKRAVLFETQDAQLSELKTKRFRLRSSSCEPRFLLAGKVHWVTMETHQIPVICVRNRGDVSRHVQAISISTGKSPLLSASPVFAKALKRLSRVFAIPRVVFPCRTYPISFDSCAAKSLSNYASERWRASFRSFFFFDTMQFRHHVEILYHCVR